MNRNPWKDETQANPLDLLAGYRRLCEAAGAARAAGSPLPRDVREELSRIEGELQTRLWLASSSPEGGQTDRPARTRKAAARPAASTAAEEAAERRPGPLLDRTAMVYSDGACIGNPGPGGYGVIVRVPGHPDQERSGGKARTTNNEMEMTAAVVGLRLATSLGARDITMVSDSEYLVKGMTGWIKGWLRNGWKTATGSPVKNRALWEELYQLTQGRSVTWTWTRGHAGDPHNERCDEMAVSEARAAGGHRAKD